MDLPCGAGISIWGWMEFHGMLDAGGDCVAHLLGSLVVLKEGEGTFCVAEVRNSRYS